MAIVSKVTEPSEITAPKKKVLVKKDQVKIKSKEVEVKKTVKTPKSESPKKPRAKKASKESKAESTSATESAGEDDKPKKKKKGINVKPTLGDICGLNLSVAKIKNIISNNCINKEAFDALQILKDHRVFPDGGPDDDDDEDDDEADDEADDEVSSPKKKKKAQKKPFTFNLNDLPDETRKYLDKCYQDAVVATYIAYNRTVITGLNEVEKKKYTTSKNEAVAKFELEQRSTHLFRDQEFDLTTFNQQYKSSFYKNIVEEDKNWKSKKDMELYDYCVTILNKTKTRFNSEAKIYITAFIEFIIKQLVINGTRECVDRNKKIIKIEHAVIESDHFNLFPFIKSTSVYKTFLADARKQDADSDADETAVDEEEDANAANKIPYKHYISELCRSVRMELSADDANDAAESKYNQTSVSKKFKQFCSDAIIELLEIFGNAIKVEVNTRNVKTVNYAIITAILYTSHVFHNVPVDPTINFIQDKYNIYIDFLKKREKRTKVD